jgi:hypothetical protein
MDLVSWIVIGSVIALAAIVVVLWNRFGRGSALDQRMGGEVAKGVDDARAKTDVTRAKDGRETGGKV